MELAFITVRFDTPGQQKFVEEKCGFGWYQHETFYPDFNPHHYVSWTEFEITSCRGKDLVIFEELDAEWWDLTDSDREAYENMALNDEDDE